jgi:hypothetical protein
MLIHDSALRRIHARMTMTPHVRGNNLSHHASHFFQGQKMVIIITTIKEALLASWNRHIYRTILFSKLISNVSHGEHQLAFGPTSAQHD